MLVVSGKREKFQIIRSHELKEIRKEASVAEWSKALLVEEN